jgi:hypothetical protein
MSETRPSHSGRDLNTTHPSHLAKLLWIDPKLPLWSEEDLAEILSHQLSTKLTTDLTRMPISDATQNELRDNEQTFADLLCASQPSIDLLRAAKEFAKTSRSDPNSLLPTQVATMLYYATIVAARLRRDETISSLAAPELLSGIEWSLSRPWLRPPLPSLFEEAKQKLT